MLVLLTPLNARLDRGIASWYGALGVDKFTTALCAKDALFYFATRGFHFATRKTNLDTPGLTP